VYKRIDSLSGLLQSRLIRMFQIRERPHQEINHQPFRWKLSGV